MQEEVTNKTVTFVVQTVRLSADIMRRMMEKYLQSRQQNHRSKKAQKQQEKLAAGTYWIKVQKVDESGDGYYSIKWK